MAKRKSKEATDDQQAAEDQREAQDQPQPDPVRVDVDEGAEGGGVRFYDPGHPMERPGQGWHRDDELDAEYRRAQGMTGAGQAITRTAEGDSLTDAPAAPGHEHKPAEPTDAMSADQIRGNPFPAAKPAIETIESGRIPGAGDPQNGVVTPEGSSPISWAAPDPATAQHDENAEDPEKVARLRADPYADHPKAAPDPFAYQRQPQPDADADPGKTEPPAKRP